MTVVVAEMQSLLALKCHAKDNMPGCADWCCHAAAYEALTFAATVEAKSWHQQSNLKCCNDRLLQVAGRPKVLQLRLLRMSWSVALLQAGRKRCIFRLCKWLEMLQAGQKCCNLRLLQVGCNRCNATLHVAGSFKRSMGWDRATHKAAAQKL